MSLDVIIAGVGGQGSILVSHIIGSAVIRTAQSKGECMKVKVGETYGATMRGGAVSSHIRIGGIAPLTREDGGDIIVGLEPLESLRVGIRYLSPNGISIINTTPVLPYDIKLGRVKYPNIEEILSALKEIGNKVYSFNATKLAIRAGSFRSMNIVMIGALFSLKKIPVNKEILLRTITESVPLNMREINKRAFEVGIQAINLD